MSKPAAIRATFVDFKPVKTRLGETVSALKTLGGAVKGDREALREEEARALIAAALAKARRDERERCATMIINEIGGK